MNLQPIEKRTKSADGLLSLHSIFHTIQGEGPFCGTPSVFVRLAGCNLQCPACDTDYTQGRRAASAQEILDNWETHAAKFKKVRPTSEPVEVALEDPSDAPTTADPVPA